MHRDCDVHTHQFQNSLLCETTISGWQQERSISSFAIPKETVKPEKTVRKRKRKSVGESGSINSLTQTTQNVTWSKYSAHEAQVLSTINEDERLTSNGRWEEKSRHATKTNETYVKVKETTRDQVNPTNTVRNQGQLRQRDKQS